MPPRIAAAGQVFWLSRADKPRIAKSEVPRKLEKASRSKGVKHTPPVPVPTLAERGHPGRRGYSRYPPLGCTTR